MFRVWQTKIRSWFSERQSKGLREPSRPIHQLAFRYGIDRRRFPRVNFPRNFPYFSLPFFEAFGVKFDIVDLSKGGVCLFDPHNDFTVALGTETEICWVSGIRKEQIQLQLVGASHQKKHLEFKKLSPELSREIAKFIESGVWGQKMRRSLLSTHSHLETQIIELWVGMQGVNLSFYSDPHHVASLEGLDFSVDFYKSSLPVYRMNGPQKGQALSVDERVKLLFFISNFPFLSPRISNLLADWARAEDLVDRRVG